MNIFFWLLKDLLVFFVDFIVEILLGIKNWFNYCCLGLVLNNFCGEGEMRILIENLCMSLCECFIRNID